MKRSLEPGSARAKRQRSAARFAVPFVSRSDALVAMKFASLSRAVAFAAESAGARRAVERKPRAARMLPRSFGMLEGARHLTNRSRAASRPPISSQRRWGFDHHLGIADGCTRFSH